MPVHSHARDRHFDEVSGAGDYWFQERRTAIRTTARIAVSPRNGELREWASGTELYEIGVITRGDKV